MIGAIIGDIVGSRFEFNNTNDRNFELFTPECSFTDDTICTVAIADAIIDYKHSKYGTTNYGAALLNWCKKYPNPMGGYGCRFNAWLNSEEHKPYGSFGNGSAMRVSPVAYAFDDMREMAREAQKTAFVTHSHKDGVRGAVAIAHLCWLALHNATKDELYDVSLQYYPNWEREKLTINSFDETCNGTIPNCFYAFFQSNNFESAIRNAITLGGDSDTIGAIVGSLAGAFYDIPGEMIIKAMEYLPKELAMVVDDFFELTHK